MSSKRKYTHLTDNSITDFEIDDIKEELYNKPGNNQESLLRNIRRNIIGHRES